MHVWHHALELPKDRPFGVNFGISLSILDWLFGTVWWPSRQESPAQQPERLGFEGMCEYPRSLLSRFLYPVSRLWLRNSSGKSQNRTD
jgi:sterol desaturase/sphingolipid hydroxylase (fatty acid hydroxylase superfamily)